MKSRVVFLSVKENFPQQLKNGEDTFQINLNIPIPAEIQSDNEDINISIANLTMDMIFSGMLRVIEEKQVKQEWIDYYCKLLLFLRPDIADELNKMKEQGLAEENYFKAYNLVKEGKAQEALSLIQIFLESYPHVWSGWFILGWALRILCRWEDAKASLLKAIELDSENNGNTNTRNELAICMMETSDYTGAKRELETALKDDPENVKIISNLAILALKTGNKDEADAYFRRVLEIDSDDPIAKNYF
ncbi:MAG: tetratricopeptide repeat protein [Treponema sp.]|nr:tetratricopeptide repeat protein [Treponema sp.]MCL2250467.1 tetratricopeptide repeat protein [Treponema sp.]